MLFTLDYEKTKGSLRLHHVTPQELFDFLKYVMQRNGDIELDTLTFTGPSIQIHSLETAWKRKMEWLTLQPDPAPHLLIPPVDPFSTNISNLFMNADIAITILSLLDVIDLVPLRRVNRRWKEIISKVPVSIDRSVEQSGRPVCHLPSILHNITEYDVRNFPMKQKTNEKGFGPKLPKLRSLNIFNWYYRNVLPYSHLTRLSVGANGTLLCNLITHFVDLRVLKVNLELSQASQLTLLSNLTTLRLHNHFLTEGDCLLTKMQSLRNICVNIGPWIRLTSLPPLHTLKLYEQMVAPLSEVQSLINQLKGFEHLRKFEFRIEHSTHLTYTSLTQLHDLTIVHPTKPGMPVAPKCFALPQLRTLKLSRVQLPYEKVNDLCVFSQLTSLSLNQSRHIRHFRKLCPNLTEFALLPTIATHEELDTLHRFQALRKLSVPYVFGNIASFSRLTQLEVLELPNVKLDATELQSLSSLTRLHFMMVASFNDRYELKKVTRKYFPYLFIRAVKGKDLT